MRRIKRKKNYNLIKLSFIILIMLLTMSIGYSLFTDRLYIRGTANIKLEEISGYYTVIFDANGGSGTMGSQTIDLGKTVSLYTNSFTKENYFFGCWNTKLDGSGIDFYDEEEVRDLASNGGTITLYAQWESNVAEIDGVYYKTLQSAIDDVSTNNTATTIKLLANTSENVTIANNKNIILNMQNHIISNQIDNAVITNNGTLTISNGKIKTSASKAGAINNNQTGHLIMTGGQIIVASTGRQAIYNDKGIVEISGNAYLYSESSSGNLRATVQNLATGTLTITGGTIISKNFHGVYNLGTMTIGTNDGNVDRNMPIIQGGANGVNSNSNYKFYDGIIKGKTTATNNNAKITEVENGYSIATDEELIDGDTYKTIYLADTVTVRFNSAGGIISETTRVIEKGTAVGTLPTTEKAGFIFEGWFTDPTNGEQINSSTIVSNDVTYYAHWTEDVTAEINGTTYTTLQGAIDAVLADNNEVTIKLLRNTNESVIVNQNKNIKFDLQNYTITNLGNNAVIENNGTVSISNGTLTSNAAEKATINNNATGHLFVSGGRIISTGTRSSIYNDEGIVEISGDAYLSSTATGTPTNSSLQRGTVHNLINSTVIITGGTIIGVNQQAVSNEGTLIVGTSDGDINTSVPSIRGEIFGIKTVGTFEFYDGTVRGINSAIDGTITTQESNSQIVDTTEQIDGKTYLVEYLE